MLKVVRPVAASVLSLAVIAAATGWLYLIQPRSALPGPPVTDALPLDELSRRSAVPLLVFLAVWITAALLLGLMARAARAERLTAGLMLALGVGGWAYVTTGLSLSCSGSSPCTSSTVSAMERSRQPSWRSHWWRVDPLSTRPATQRHTLASSCAGCSSAPRSSATRSQRSGSTASWRISPLRSR